VIARIRDEVARGRQVYWVCPLVEESEHIDLQNATETHAELSAALPGVQMVGLLHGRMPAAEKAAVMALFHRRADGGAGGHHGDRGGRGRAQRQPDGDRACRALRPGAAAPAARPRRPRRGGQRVRAAVHGPLSPTGKARLRAMAETNDGFEIARRDLEIRGPGEFMGARQSGDALLRFADLADDAPLLQARPAPRRRCCCASTRRPPRPMWRAGWPAGPTF
jgi:ATP-dependent DNA helicase RecG